MRRLRRNRRGDINPAIFLPLIIAGGLVFAVDAMVKAAIRTIRNPLVWAPAVLIALVVAGGLYAHRSGKKEKAGVAKAPATSAVRPESHAVLGDGKGEKLGVSGTRVSERETINPRPAEPARRAASPVGSSSEILHDDDLHKTP